MMDILNDLLNKYKQLSIDQEKIKETVRRVIKKETNIDLNNQLIVLKNNNVVYLKISPLIKGEIFMRREKILDLINDSLPKNSKIIIK